MTESTRSGLTSKFWEASSIQAWTSASVAGFLVTGLGETTMLRTSRPVRASVRPSDIKWGASAAAVGGKVGDVPGDVLSALRLAIVMAIETAAPAANGEQKRICLFYPIITGNLPSARRPGCRGTKRLMLIFSHGGHRLCAGGG